MHAIDRIVSHLWPADNLNVLYVCQQNNIQHLSEKCSFRGLVDLPGCAELQVSWGAKIMPLVIAYCQSNISTKKIKIEQCLLKLRLKYRDTFCRSAMMLARYLAVCLSVCLSDDLEWHSRSLTYSIAILFNRWQRHSAMRWRSNCSVVNNVRYRRFVQHYMLSYIYAQRVFNKK